MSKKSKTNHTLNVTHALPLVLVIVTLAAIGWLAWRGMLAVPANVARAWALIATASLPCVAWTGWWFGHTEARGRLAGIDQTVDKVMGAAARTAGLHVGTAQAMRQTRAAPPPAPPIVILPDVEIVPRQLRSGHEIIEM